MTYPRVEKMKVADLNPAHYNPRTITDQALEGLGNSVDRFGLVELPIYNKRTKRLVGGHQRLKVMKKKKMDLVDVVVVDIDEIEEKALNVTLNNQEIAGTYTDGLQDILAELAEHDTEWMESLNMAALLEMPEEAVEPDPEPDTSGDDILPTKKRKAYKDGQAKKVGQHQIVCSDCISHLKSMPDNSVDSIVTDPPYGIGFMGKEWDVAVPGIEWATECLRVLKPGGHIIAFAATRTLHRLAVAIEDAGFEIRDTISWLYWQGFPKSHSMSKAIDAAQGESRYGSQPSWNSDGENQHTPSQNPDRDQDPRTADAKKWDGWGTALKPSQEPAILARKPVAGTVADNVLEHGTGAINVDGCRIAYGDPAWPGPGDALDLQDRTTAVTGKGSGCGVELYGKYGVHRDASSPKGRWPGNIYVCPKPAGSEKDEGVEEESSSNSAAGPGGWDPRQKKNHHPTVKPVALMRWLIRLVTPPGGTVVDTFLGSGTTMVAAEREGFPCVGIEMSGEFAALSEARVKFAIGKSK